MANIATTPRIETIRTVVGMAEVAVREAYWVTCYTSRHALDPHDMGLPDWAEELLSETFMAARVREGAPGGWDGAINFPSGLGLRP